MPWQENQTCTLNEEKAFKISNTTKKEYINTEFAEGKSNSVPKSYM